MCRFWTIPHRVDTDLISNRNWEGEVIWRKRQRGSRAKTSNPGHFEILKVRIKEQFSPPMSAKNLPTAVWDSHQRDDPFLGRIYRTLSAKGTSSKSETDKKVLARATEQAHSYRLQDNLLLYRSIREVGLYDIDEGWALAVPTSLRDKVISECHGDGDTGHGGVRKTTLLLRQRYGSSRVHPSLCDLSTGEISYVISGYTTLTDGLVFPIQCGGHRSLL